MSEPVGLRILAITAYAAGQKAGRAGDPVTACPYRSRRSAAAHGSAGTPAAARTPASRSPRPTPTTSTPRTRPRTSTRKTL